MNDLDETRREGLFESDNSKFTWFHFKVVMVAGVGFFTDAYNLFAINIATIMLGIVYNPSNGALTAGQDLGLKIASPIGTLLGQLFFGWAADIFGRKRMYGYELCIMIVAALVQAMAGHASAVSIMGVLIFWRLIMGIGIGGDYPLSAVISSEFAPIKTRGRLMSAVVAAQGWVAALVSTIVVAAFKEEIIRDGPTDPRHVDMCWRILIGLGCIPATFAIFFRLTIPETPRFTMDIERNVRQASQNIKTFLTTGIFVVDPDAVVQRAMAPKASRRDFIAYFRQWENLKVLIGTAYSWFALDIAFYGLGLNSSIIIEGTNILGSKVASGAYTNGETIYQTLIKVSRANIILSIAGLIPGYYVTFLCIDSWGRKPIQYMGFSVLTVIFVIMGFGYNTINTHSEGAFVFLYCLANFFQNFGPNTTTFIVPGEAFPTRYRSTAHGISGACGKLGAILAQVAFTLLKDHGGTNVFVKHMFEIMALFMLTGILSTRLLPDTKRRSLEDISNEEQEFFISGPATMVEVEGGVVVREHPRAPPS